MGRVIADLRRATEAVERARHGDALQILLEVWRNTRAPALADVIDLVSKQAREAQRPIEAKTAKSRARQWDEVLARNLPEELELLLEGIPNEKIDEATRRVSLLAPCAPDPRLSRGLLELVAALPFSSNSALKFWTLVSEVIADCADPRAAGAASWISKRHAALVSRDRSDTVLAKLKKVDAAIKKAVPKGADGLSPDEASAVAALRAKLVGQTRRSDGGEELLAAVYERVSDSVTDLGVVLGSDLPGVASVQISAELSPDARQRLERVLRNVRVPVTFAA